jgi:hypothetical protein
MDVWMRHQCLEIAYEIWTPGKPTEKMLEQKMLETASKYLKLATIIIWFDHVYIDENLNGIFFFFFFFRQICLTN